MKQLISCLWFFYFTQTKQTKFNTANAKTWRLIKETTNKSSKSLQSLETHSHFCLFDPGWCSVITSTTVLDSAGRNSSNATQSFFLNKFEKDSVNRRISERLSSNLWKCKEELGYMCSSVTPPGSSPLRIWYYSVSINSVMGSGWQRCSSGGPGRSQSSSGKPTPPVDAAGRIFHPLGRWSVPSSPRGAVTSTGFYRIAQKGSEWNFVCTSCVSTTSGIAKKLK